MAEPTYAISAISTDNTSEPATVLSISLPVADLGFVDAFAQFCPAFDVCELATTIHPAWTTMCAFRCSVFQPFVDSPPPSRMEIDMYQFDAMHLAWSLGRLGLHSHFIVAPASNGTTPFEEDSTVKLGFTFDLLFLPCLCAHPRPELADPNFIEAMRVVAFRWKQYQKLRTDLYNPRTQNHCLFMCAAFILRQHGIAMSQQQVRDRVAKLWLAGAECFGGSLQHWAAVRQMTPQVYLDQLRSSGWGSAADACIFANSLHMSCYIYDHNGELLVSSPCSRSLFALNLRLAGDHYTVVDEKNICHGQRHLQARYWFRSPSTRQWRLLKHLPAFLRACRHYVPPQASRTGSSCPSTSSLPSCGGAMRAQTQVNAERPFQIVGRGEDGLTPHIVQNVHDLAIYTAQAPADEEDQPYME
eukprot:6490346-Amphidinium_carterae.1